MVKVNVAVREISVSGGQVNFNAEELARLSGKLRESVGLLRYSVRSVEV